MTHGMSWDEVRLSLVSKRERLVGAEPRTYDLSSSAPRNVVAVNPEV